MGVAQFFSTLMRTPPAILAAFIVVLSVIGAYGVRNNIFDVYVCLAFGVIGWAMKRIGFPRRRWCSASSWGRWPSATS
jgi:putative tricarboxylic transport membrane protein